MADILRLLLILLLLTISLSAFFLVVGALFPSRVTRTKSIVNLSPGRSFALGMVNFMFFGLIAVVLFSIAENSVGFFKGLLVIPALLITILLTILLSIGLTAVVSELGERLFPDTPMWRRSLWSAVLLCIACALPFVGWFLLLPYVGLVGIGATIQGFVQRPTSS